MMIPIIIIAVVESPLKRLLIQMCCLSCSKLMSCILFLFQIVLLWISLMSLCSVRLNVIFRLAKAPSISRLLLVENSLLLNFSPLISRVQLLNVIKKFPVNVLFCGPQSECIRWLKPLLMSSLLSVIINTCEFVFRVTAAFSAFHDG